MTDKENLMRSSEAERLLNNILMGKDHELGALQHEIECLSRAGRAISFRGLDFAKFREKTDDGVLRFENVDFNECFVDFGEVDFGEGNVSFRGAKFRAGVTFQGARFGNGDVDFDDVEIDRELDFRTVCQGGGNLSFRGAQLRGRQDFCFLDLGSKCLEFSESKKGKKFRASGEKFQLRTATHQDGIVNFTLACLDSRIIDLDFGQSTSIVMFEFFRSRWRGKFARIRGITLSENGGSLSFRNCHFNDFEALSFSVKEMKESNIRFTRCVFPREGATTFDFGPITGGTLRFDNSIFGESTEFLQGRGAEWCCPFSFRGARFEGSLDITELSFGYVPDFTGTKLSRHLSLDGLTLRHVNLRDAKSSRHFTKNSAKLQRLKELAENNRAHQQALQFHAYEMRSRRWKSSGLLPWAADSLDWLYDLFSNYGQSIARPLFLLLLTCLGFGHGYASIGVGEDKALIFSAATSIPFLPVSSVLRNKELEVLLGDPATADLTALYWMMGAQGVLSFVFLFLLGLGLRNRFRL